MKRSSFIYSLFFTVFSMLFLLSFVFDNNVFAKDFADEVIVKSDEINIDLTNNISNTDFNSVQTKGLSLPNGVGVKVTPSVTGVTLEVENYGIDTVDSVTVKMSTPNYYKKKGRKNKTVTFTKLKPFIKQTKTMSIPMIRAAMTYNGDVIVRDGKAVAYKTARATLTLTNEQLNREWLKGKNSKNIKESIDYHFAKHYNDKFVRVKNMTQYLNKASAARKAMKNKTKSTSKYRVVTQKGDSSARKVTRLVGQKEYIIFSKSSKKLYSYGGNG